ncbi:acyltransferase [soil metagenome]
MSNSPASLYVACMQQRSAFLWFDLCRFLAAMIVVLEHARDLTWVSAPMAPDAGLVYKMVYLVTGFGHEAVIIFFILSGFWISSTVDRRRHLPDFSSKYLIDRLTRLLIVLVPALVIGGSLDMVGAYGMNGQLYQGPVGATISHSVVSSLTPSAFIGNLAFLQTLLVPAFGSNGPLWSLAYEFWYYMWYPALLLSLTKRRLSPFIASLIIAALWPKLVPGFAVWMLGSILYRLDARRIGRDSLSATVKWSLLGTSILLSLGMLVASRLRFFSDESSTLVVGLSFFFLFWSILLVEPRFPRSFKAMTKYGAASSFSIYVTHFPFVALVATVFLHGERLYPNLLALATLSGIILAAWAYGWLFSQATEARTASVRSWLNKREPIKAHA